MQKSAATIQDRTHNYPTSTSSADGDISQLKSRHHPTTENLDIDATNLGNQPAADEFSMNEFSTDDFSTDDFSMSERPSTTATNCPLPPEPDAFVEAEPDSQTRLTVQAASRHVEFELESAIPSTFTRDQRRSRRKRATRARTINISRFAKSALELGRLLQPEVEMERPVTRLDCWDQPRPCPFVSCRHHLYLDVSPGTGSIKLNFPDLEVWEMTQSCSLDLADRGPQGAELVGAVMNLTRERVRQLENRGLLKLCSHFDTPQAAE